MSLHAQGTITVRRRPKDGSDGNDSVRYWLVPSTTRVTRSQNGTPMPSTVSCVKMKQVGNGPAAETAELSLRKQFGYADGSQSDVTYYTGAVGILDNCVWLKFLLHDGNTVVCSETVSVLEAATGYTSNLIYNSSFRNNGEGWIFASGVSIDITKNHNGNAVMKSSQSGLTTSCWRGPQQHASHLIAVNPGDKLTASLWVYAENPSVVDGGCAVEVEWFSSINSTSRSGSNGFQCAPATAYTWVRKFGSVTVPTGVYACRFRVYVTKNGTVWFASPKLEKGINADPQWTPHPSDLLGDSVTSVEELYQLGTSNTTPPAGAWKATADYPTSTNKYLWNKEKVTYFSGKVEYTEPHVCATYVSDGKDGKDGTNGTNGTNGKDGVNGKDGENGKDGINGTNGKDGENGEDGVGIESITEYYQVSSNDKFNKTTMSSKWKTEVPTMTVELKYLWNMELITYTNGKQEYTDPRIIGVYGDTGEPGKPGNPGQDGAPGLQGLIIRHSEWKSGVEYRNDSAETTEIRYLDIAMVRNAQASEGWDVYRCNKTHTSSATIGVSNNTYWTKLSNVGPIYTSLIIANDASIEFMQGNQLLIKKSDGTVTAGMSGAGSGTSGIRMWAGATTPAAAPFRVDEDGHLVASRAIITGNIQATSGTFNGYIQSKFVQREDSDALWNESTKAWRLNTHLNVQTQGESIELPNATKYIGARVLIMNDCFTYTRTTDWTTTVKVQGGYRIYGTLTQAEMRSTTPPEHPKTIAFASMIIEFVGFKHPSYASVCSWIAINYKQTDDFNIT